MRVFIDRNGMYYKALEAKSPEDTERLGADRFMLAALTDEPQYYIDVEARIQLFKTDPTVFAEAEGTENVQDQLSL